MSVENNVNTFEAAIRLREAELVSKYARRTLSKLKAPEARLEDIDPDSSRGYLKFLSRVKRDTFKEKNGEMEEDKNDQRPYDTHLTHSEIQTVITNWNIFESFAKHLIRKDIEDSKCLTILMHLAEKYARIKEQIPHYMYRLDDDMDANRKIDGEGDDGEELWGHTFLHLAVCFDKVETAKYLSKEIPNLIVRDIGTWPDNRKKYLGLTPFHIAVAYGNTTLVKHMLDIHKHNYHLDGMTDLLHGTDIVLFDKDLDGNRQIQEPIGRRMKGTVFMGQLPLHVAVLCLINVGNKTGSLSEVSDKRTYTRMIDELLSNLDVKSLDVRNFRGETVFHTIVRFIKCFPHLEGRAIEVMQQLDEQTSLLIDSKRDIFFARNTDHDTALQLATEFGCTEIFHYFLHMENIYVQLHDHDDIYEIRRMDVTDIDKVNLMFLSQDETAKLKPQEDQLVKDENTFKEKYSSAIQYRDRLDKITKRYEVQKSKITQAKRKALNENTKPSDDIHEKYDKKTQANKNKMTDGKKKLQKRLLSSIPNVDEYVKKMVNNENLLQKKREDLQLKKKRKKIPDHTTQSIAELLCCQPLHTATALLRQDVFNALIQRKWHSYRCFICPSLVFHLLWMVLLYLHTIGKSALIEGTVSIWSSMEVLRSFVLISSIFNFVFGFIYLLQEVVFRCMIAKQPFQIMAVHHNGVYRVLTIVFALCIIADSVINLVRPVQNKWFILFALILGTWMMMFFIRIFQYTSVYVVLLNEALIKAVVPFAMLLSMQLFTFSVCMHSLFGYPGTAGVSEDFTDFRYALLNMGKLMIGLTDFSDLLQTNERALAVIVFTIFMVTTFLLMINSLIAVMTNRFVDTQTDRVQVWYLQKLSVIIFFEGLFVGPLVCLAKGVGRQEEVRSEKEEGQCRYIMSYRKTHTITAAVHGKQAGIHAHVPVPASQMLHIYHFNSGGFHRNSNTY